MKMPEKDDAGRENEAEAEEAEVEAEVEEEVAECWNPPPT